MEFAKNERTMARPAAPARRAIEHGSQSVKRKYLAVSDIVEGTDTHTTQLTKVGIQLTLAEKSPSNLAQVVY